MRPNDRCQNSGLEPRCQGGGGALILAPEYFLAIGVRQVLECGSPLPLWGAWLVDVRWRFDAQKKSARGLDALQDAAAFA